LAEGSRLERHSFPNARFSKPAQLLADLPSNTWWAPQVTLLTTRFFKPPLSLD